MGAAENLIDFFSQRELRFFGRPEVDVRLTLIVVSLAIDSF
jgi:hypothetical protein